MLNLDNSIVPVDAVFRETVFCKQLFLKIEKFPLVDDLPVQHDSGDGHTGDIARYAIAKICLSGDEHLNTAGSRFSNGFEECGGILSRFRSLDGVLQAPPFGPASR